MDALRKVAREQLGEPTARGYEKPLEDIAAHLSPNEPVLHVFDLDLTVRYPKKASLNGALVVVAADRLIVGQPLLGVTRPRGAKILLNGNRMEYAVEQRSGLKRLTGAKNKLSIEFEEQLLEIDIDDDAAVTAITDAIDSWRSQDEAG